MPTPNPFEKSFDTREKEILMAKIAQYEKILQCNKIKTTIKNIYRIVLPKLKEDLINFYH
jgi:hypothetical protein